MPYQPNYCNHCGENVERIKWNFLTSEHFCEDCESTNRKVDWKPKIYLAIGLIGILFGFGSYLKTPDKPVSLTANQFTTNATNKIQTVKNESAINSNVSNAAAKPNVQANVGLQNQTKAELTKKEAPSVIQAENTQIAETEPVYFCGAQTKKGTPCTRKVKGGGRCWQHEGHPAMLPKAKLAASR